MTSRANGERSGLVVIVPTTAGAIQVMGLRWSQKIPSSRVVLGNETSDQCERWTKEYNSLLRPGDPMRTLMGLHEGGGYRLVVSAEIDHGRSWMMPVSAGHFGAAKGEALHNDVARARLMIWTTGAIDYSQPETMRDAKVVENDYHLVGKIDHSRALFAAAAHAGTPVLCVLPKGPDAEKAANVLAKVLGSQPHHVAIAGSLAELIQPLEGFLKSGDFTALPENAQPLALYVPPPAEEDRTASDDPAPEPETVAAAPPPPRPETARAAPPLAGTHATAAPYGDTAKGESRLPIGALIGVGLLALAGGGAYFALNGLGSGPTALPAAQNPTPQQPQQQAAANPPLTIQPVRPTQPAQPSQPAQTQTTQPVQPTQPAQPQQTATAPANPTGAPPATGAPPVARLTLLTAPAGSSCQAQIYQMQPRFAEVAVDVPADQPVVEIDGANLCGLSVSGASFQRGSGSATVQSLSTASRIVFTQSGQPIAPPALSTSGGARVELRLR